MSVNGSFQGFPGTARCGHLSCQMPCAPNSGFCIPHTCPVCYVEKSSKEPDCGRHGAPQYAANNSPHADYGAPQSKPCGRPGCPNPAVPTGRLCHLHTCPRCGSEKPSGKDDCGQHPINGTPSAARPPPINSAALLSSGGRKAPTGQVPLSPGHSPVQAQGHNHSVAQQCGAGLGCAIGFQSAAQNELEHLKSLQERGILTAEEFQKKKAEVDEKLNRMWHRRIATPNTVMDIKGGFVTHCIRGRMYEKAFKFTFNYEEQRWSKSVILIHMDPQPFSQGAARLAYVFRDLSRAEGEDKFVAKLSKDPNETQKIYFIDVEMQALCKFMAKEYNKRAPPKLVDFVDASVIECIERNPPTVFASEPFIQGKYDKYNNNYGYVAPAGRNTPQAFSHFTYNFSGGQVLVCDIQGVDDYYTDPQVHSISQQGFGKGDVGVEGIKRFFATHRCNDICEYLGLTKKAIKTSGTMAKPRKTKSGQPLPGPSPSSGPVLTTGGGRYDDNPYADTPIDGEPTSEALNYFGITKSQFDSIRNAFLEISGSKYTLEPKQFYKLCGRLNHPDMSAVYKITSRYHDEGQKITFGHFLMFWTGHMTE